jgi:hypothetical protein
MNSTKKQIELNRLHMEIEQAKRDGNYELATFTNLLFKIKMEGGATEVSHEDPFLNMKLEVEMTAERRKR